MDGKLVLIAMFVMLGWMCVATRAQTNATATTAASNATMAATTVASNATMAATTAASNATMAATTAASNATMAATTAASNVTMAATTAASNVTMAATAASNATMAATTAASNATMAATTAASNVTMAATAASNATMAATTAASNATMAATTAASNATMAPATTAAPPLTPNITVTVLTATISNSECGTQQLCAAQPANCNPNATGSCFFLAAKQTSGQNFEFSLSGESDGYLACTLTPSASTGNDTTYICANDNGNVKFFSAFRTGNTLTTTELPVNNVKGSISNRTIQCTFAATVPDSTTRAAGFSLRVATGAFNSTSGTLGTPNDQIRTPVVNLANPNQTVTNTINSNNSTNSTTAAPTPAATTGSAITLQQSISQVMLIILGVLSLAML